MSDAHDLLVDYWDELYPHDDYREQNLKLTTELMNRFRGERQIRVLDLCCGTGRALSLFPPEERFKLFGVDESRRMIEGARRHFPKAQFINLSVTGIRKGIFSQRDFHFVTMVGGSIHLFSHDERRQIFREVNEMLTDGGALIIDVFRSGGSTVEGEGPQVWIKKAFAKGGREVIVLYERIKGGAASKQIVYLIERESAGYPVFKWSDAILFDLTTEVVEGELADYSEVKTLTTDYKTTEFMIATK